MDTNSIEQLYSTFFSREDVMEKFESLLKDFVSRSGTFGRSLASISFSDKKDLDKLIGLINKIDQDMYENETDEETNKYIFSLIEQMIYYMCLYSKLSAPNEAQKGIEDSICNKFLSDSFTIEIKHDRKKLSEKLKNDLKETREWLVDLCKRNLQHTRLENIATMNELPNVNGKYNIGREINNIYAEMLKTGRGGKQAVPFKQLDGSTPGQLLVLLNVLGAIYNFDVLGSTKDENLEADWIEKYVGYGKRIAEIEKEEKDKKQSANLVSLIKGYGDKISGDKFIGARAFYDIIIKRNQSDDDKKPDPGFTVTATSTIPFDDTGAGRYEEVFNKRITNGRIKPFAFLPPEQNLYELMSLASNDGIIVNTKKDNERGLMVTAQWKIVYPSTNKIDIRKFASYPVYRKMMKAISNMYNNFNFEFEMMDLLMTNGSIWAKYLDSLYNKGVTTMTNSRVETSQLSNIQTKDTDTEQNKNPDAGLGGDQRNALPDDL